MLTHAVIDLVGIVDIRGFGRELSRSGMLEFVDIKSIRFYDQSVRGPYGK